MEPLHAPRGFTLIELLVVMVIITIITAVVLTSQGSFNRSLVLANTAYDIALTIRSTETFGLSTRARGTIVNAGYGLHFTAAPQESFTLFVDSWPAPPCSTPDCNAGDFIYNGTDVFVQDYNLNNGIRISGFCAYAGGWRCDIAWLDIVFQRPNPNAFMKADGVSTPITQACLTLSTRDGSAHKYISVQQSGQIIANAASCGPLP